MIYPRSGGDGGFVKVMTFLDVDGDNLMFGPMSRLK